MALSNGEPEEAIEYEDIADLRKQYIDYTSAKIKEIEEREEAEAQYHGEQWTKEQEATLRQQRRLPFVNNMISKKLNSTVGVMSGLRLDPKTYPRNEKTQGSADVATEALRYVFDNNQFADKESRITLNLLTSAISGVEWSLKPSKYGDLDPMFEMVNARNFFYDPCSVELDFSDASYMGVAKWMDVATIKSMFPDKEKEISGVFSNSEGDYRLDPKNGGGSRFLDRKNKQAILVDHWYKKGGRWLYAIYIGELILSEGASYLQDEDGQDVCRYQMVRAFVDHNFDTYSIIRNMKWSQWKYNHHASRAMWLLNARRIVAERGAFDNVETARTEAARPDGFLERNKGFDVSFEDSKSQSDLAAQISFMEIAKNEIESMGFNPSLVGDMNNKSGKAIQLLQKAGIAELGTFLAAYKAFKLSLYRIGWALACQHWTAERWIRVTGDEEIMQFMPINQRQVDEYGQEFLINSIADLDVDIIIEEGADNINIMSETLEALQAAAAQGQAIPPQITLELLQIPQKTKKKLMGMLDEANAPNPAQEQAAQINLAQIAADVEDTKAAAEKKNAETQKIMAEIQKSLAELQMVAMQAYQQQEPQLIY